MTTRRCGNTSCGLGSTGFRQGIDGWRLDVPYEVETEGFWQEFRDRVKAVNPDAYIVGEIWTEAVQWLDGTQFDGVMNYPFTSATLAFAAGDRVRMDLVEIPHYFPYPALDAEGYASKIDHLLKLYPWDIQLTQLNLLSSHDVARALSVVSEDESSMVLATLLLFTYPGAPSIYYGDEVGLPGELDPDSRRTFPHEKDWDQTLLKLHKELITLRHNHPALRTGGYEVLHAADQTYVFARTLDAEKVIVALNTAEMTPVSLATQELIDEKASLKSVFTYGEAKCEDGKMSLPPRSGIVCTVK